MQPLPLAPSLAEHLCHLDFLEEAIAWAHAQVDDRLRSFAAELERLDETPGVNRRVAGTLLAEIGPSFSPGMGISLVIASTAMARVLPFLSRLERMVRWVGLASSL